MIIKGVITYPWRKCVVTVTVEHDTYGASLQLTPDTIRFYMAPNDHYSDVIMAAAAYQITSLTIVYSTVYSGADQRKHQSSASLAFVQGIHR